MNLFNISFHTHPDLKNEVLHVIRQQFVPAMEQSGIFGQPTITEVMLETDQNNVCLGLQMTTDRFGEALDWFESVASPLIRLLYEQYGDKVMTFMTPMKIHTLKPGS